jgi:hypothetical protein
VKKLYFIIIILFLFTFTFCAGNAGLRMSVEEDWIEGKPYPVKISFKKADEVSNVTLYYSFNNNPTTSVQLNRVGRDFSYTIPGEEVVAGYLTYYVSYMFNEEQVTSNNVEVRVLTLEEAKAKLEEELYNRLSHDPPTEVLETEDLKLELTVRDSKPSTDVKIYYKRQGDSRYQDEELDGDGRYTYTISEEQLRSGYNTYYYRVREDNPDVGELEVFLPSGGKSNPFMFSIISEAELLSRMQQQLAESLYHIPPGDVYEIFDRRILLTIDYPSGSFLEEFAVGTPEVYIYYRRPNSSNYREGVMIEEEDGIFSYKITANELEDGYNTYYFYVMVNTDDLGTVQTEFKSQTDPFKFNIITKNEIRKIAEDELYQSIIHTPPEYAYEMDDLELFLELEYKEDSIIFEETQDYTDVYLLYGKGRNFSSYKKVSMMNLGERKFTFTISSNDLQEGKDSYYFQVEEDTKHIGEIDTYYPGERQPITFEILTQEDLEDELISDLYRRISHEPIEEVDGLNPVEIRLSVEAATDMTSAYLNYKRESDDTYQTRKMNRNGEVFLSEISAELQQQGYNQYYFVVEEEYVDLGIISIDYPEDGANDPFEFVISDTDSVIDNLEDNLRNRLKHDPVREATADQPLELILEYSYVIDGTVAELHYKRERDNTYKGVTATDMDGYFSATIRPDELEAGYNQYYFEVREPNDYLGDIVITLPEEGGNGPYEFDIITVEDLLLENIYHDPLPDVDYGTTVTARITLDYIPQGTEVYLKYKQADDIVDYHTLSMRKTGNIYEVNMSSAFLQEDVTINYYFLILVPPMDIEVTYPENPPLSFDVLEVEDDDEDDDNAFGGTDQTDDNMLKGKVYALPQGTSQLPDDWDDLTQLTTLYTRTLNISPREFTEGFPGVSQFEWFAIRYTGTIVIHDDGNYKWRLLSDDGSKLYIDGDLIVDNDGQHSPKSKVNTVNLDEGSYPIVVEYFQGPATQLALQLFVKEPGEPEKIFHLDDFE